MVIFRHPRDLQSWLSLARASGKTLGFVPTMGALHAGHISLIQEARRACELVACSIFVNPTQFNNPTDLEKYPVTLEADIAALVAAGTDLLFLPGIADIYPDGMINLPHYDLGALESILEGEYRPGHFQGVCQVVHRLLSAVTPDKLFMGLKDYQQCMVVAKLILSHGLPVRLVTLPTLRESDGLAMSSRNMRLDAGARKLAPTIFEVLSKIKDGLKPGPMESLVARGVRRLETAGFQVDYLEIADARDLSEVKVYDGVQPLVGLVAAFLGEVRLIDNLRLNME